jgi:hypothetical protein
MSVLYGCETWYVALTEDHRLRIFEEKSALRRMFGVKRDAVSGDLEKTVIFSKYYYNDQIKDFEIGETCSMYGGDEKCVQNVGYIARMKYISRET